MIIDRYKIREQNETLVLSTIIQHSLISRASISQLTGLNKASTSAIVKDLIDESLVIEIGTGDSTSAGGRKPILLSLNKASGYSLSIDLGYDYISSMLTNLYGEIVEQNKERNTFVRIENVIEKVTAIVESYRTYYEGSTFQLVGLTLAIHGIVDENRIVFTPYYDLDQMDLAKKLHEQLQIPVYVENEANLTALAETSFSSFKPNLVSISIHSGIGAGIIMNGELYYGHNGQSGEIGHMILYPNGLTCPCGNRGCIEQYCSEKAVVSQYRQLKKNKELSLNDLAQDYMNGDESATALVERAALEISIGIRNIISGFAPEVVYINSPLTRKLPFMLDLIDSHVSSKFSKDVPILASELGSKASLLGAAVMNLQNFFNIPNLYLSKEPEVMAEVSSL
ncbi:ROK family protein [Jeotgalibaca caeni]|uniref:ROK family protein n=1 Tax=Jeotgalibaca caeni TaxID=3028623 RepID=UPI00237EB31A|nr:ROK family protein [Jeotgalibaca caeni]MDE1548939.1 ROK family protein [Jeotgalibaca caeni]